MSQNTGASQGSKGPTKVFPSPEAALDGLTDGHVVLVGGFDGLGSPEALLKALSARGVGNLTCICQGAWASEPQGGNSGLVQLAASGLLSKLMAPLPFQTVDSSERVPIEERWRSGLLEIETVPQGILAERLRAGGSGLGGIFLPTGVGGRFQDGREVRQFNGQDHIFHPAIHADFALIRAAAADVVGNLVFDGAHRNWNPVMAMAATVSIAEVDEIRELGGLDPELVISPGIFVNRVVQTL